MHAKAQLMASALEVASLQIGAVGVSPADTDLLKVGCRAKVYAVLDP